MDKQIRSLSAVILISLFKNQEVQITREVFGIAVPGGEKFKVDEDLVFQATEAEPPQQRVFALLRAPDESDNVCKARLLRLEEFARCYSLVSRTPVSISSSLGMHGIPVGDVLDLTLLGDISATRLVAHEEARRAFDDAAKLSRITVPGYLRNAITYYCRSTQAETRDEELIDLVVSLESLFSRNVAELRYRLSLLVSYFLSPQDGARRKKTFDLVYSAYDLRSKILHDGKPLEPADQKVVPEVSRLVRTLILGLIPLRNMFGTKQRLVDSVGTKIVAGTD